MENATETINYPASINNFRSLMESFLVVQNGYWKSSKGEILRLRYDSTIRAPGREGWRVHILDEENGSVSESSEKAGMIMAFETITAETTIHFLDGCLYFGEHSQGSSYSDKPLDLTRISCEYIGKSLALLAKEILGLYSKADKNNEQDSVSQEPKTRDLMNDWFPYFHRVKGQIRITLRDIAEKTNYNYDYVRQQHALYLKKTEEK